MREIARENFRREGGDPIESLNRTIFGQLCFRANRGDYYDVRNSLFDEVLDRRLGIPITLSVLYIDLADAIGAQVEGVSSPAHFLLREREQGRLLDPFEGGRVIDHAGCLRILDSIGLSPEDWSDEFLRRASRREILHRMINNLRASYHRSGDARRLEIVEQMFSALELGERAGVPIQ
jgi:regulator of sirC expression with transglutaminase-like and TPR domain